MRNESKKVIRITTWIAGLAAIGIALIIPIFYFGVSYQYIVGSLEAEAEINSRVVSGLINANPELWRYEEMRLEELLARRPLGGHKEIRRVIDLQNMTVAESADPLRPPLAKRTRELKDAGVTVGWIEISRSLFPLIIHTGLSALLGLSIGFIVFLVFRVLPVRAVVRAEEELSKAQEELVRKEKLAVLGLIAGNMGNELRNPLGVMNNAVYYLKSKMPDSDETVREYLDIIKSEIDNAEGIMLSCLDFYAMKTPRAKVVTVPELISQGLRNCTLPENVTVQTDTPDTSPALNIDTAQMVRVLQNLITNSVQAMPNGGTLRIAACHRVQGSRFEVRGSENNIEHGTLNIEPDADFIEISVSDTGVGIAPENMGKLFQPLYTTKPRGIGLGLALASKLTEANGGRIEVESEMGEGTVFKVMLPITGNEVVND